MIGTNFGIFGNSIEMIENVFLTEKRTRKIKVKRSLYERLFTRPWRPFLKEKEIEEEYEVPSEKYYIIENNGKKLIAMHPAMKEKFLKALDEHNEKQKREQEFKEKFIFEKYSFPHIIPTSWNEPIGEKEIKLWQSIVMDCQKKTDMGWMGKLLQ